MHKILKVNFVDPLYREVLNLRYKVLREPIGMVFSEADIEYDKKVIYFAYLKSEQILGVVGLDLSHGNKARLTQMAVAENTQGLGIGRELVAALEEFCIGNGVNEVFLDARYPARGFYNRLGYMEFSDVFEKIGIPHVKMRKTLI